MWITGTIKNSKLRVGRIVAKEVRKWREPLKFVRWMTIYEIDSCGNDIGPMMGWNIASEK